MTPLVPASHRHPRPTRCSDARRPAGLSSSVKQCSASVASEGIAAAVPFGKLRQRLAAAVLSAALLAALGGCGGSSSSTSASKTTSVAGATHSKTVAKALNAFSACMRAHGAAGAPAKGSTTPAASTHTYRAASRACTAKLTPVLAKATAPPPPSAKSTPKGSKAHVRAPLRPAIKLALERFAACMRRHGVNMAPPNTSGVGPIFPAAHLPTRTPRFTSAEKSCNPTLQKAF